MRIAHVLFREVMAWCRFFIIWLPGSMGVFARRLLLKNNLQYCGTMLITEQGVRFFETKKMRFGNDVSIGYGCSFFAQSTEAGIEIGNNVSFNEGVMVNADAGGEISIGNNVIIGPGVVIRSSDHIFTSRDVPIRSQGHLPGTIIIEEDVWIAANVVIVGNVRVGRGAVIAAGAVVVKDVSPYFVVGGVPAMKIKDRPNNQKK